MKSKKKTNEIKRCGWCGVDPLYIRYHDEEWGREVTEDDKMFEFIVLEGAQAGLSWITILKRRDNYKKAFANFDVRKVAKFTEKQVESLLQNSGIIRNRNKIESTISNARCFIEIQKEFGSFCQYLKSFLPNGKPIINHWKTLKEIPATTALSDTISKDMKKRGFKFFGSTICYAHIQAVGYVNDHLIDCHCRKNIQKKNSKNSS
ncbi:MAG: DNA-3-methyladenine glycosylase I [Planctomycetaceae bacterium]|jgi:DNA-3-methyladenine glycosylase I|nr:DNA-3-methyladenine glycosylase I [Planctomycetaceae bacterium]